MDPNETLRELRRLVTRLSDQYAGDDSAAAQAMAEKFDALDEWLSRGGFLPSTT